MISYLRHSSATLIARTQLFRFPSTPSPHAHTRMDSSATEAVAGKVEEKKTLRKAVKAEMRMLSEESMEAESKTCSTAYTGFRSLPYVSAKEAARR